MRGDVHRLRAPRGALGHEQQGSRYAVVVQSDGLHLLSTWMVAPTSTSARPATFRPGVEIDGIRTRVLVEQTSAVDPGRLGEQAGHLGLDELRAVDAALRLVLGRSHALVLWPQRRRSAQVLERAYHAGHAVLSADERDACAEEHEDSSARKAAIGSSD